MYYSLCLCLLPVSPLREPCLFWINLNLHMVLGCCKGDQCYRCLAVWMCVVCAVWGNICMFTRIPPSRLHELPARTKGNVFYPCADIHIHGNWSYRWLSKHFIPGGSESRIRTWNVFKSVFLKSSIWLRNINLAHPMSSFDCLSLQSSDKISINDYII